MEGGANTGFSFTLAGVTHSDNADWFYAKPGGINEKSMKRALHQGGKNALNLYSTTAGPYLGWAYLPDIVTKPGQAFIDGIVFDWETVPGASTTYAGRSTWARRSRTRPATGSTSSTRSSAAATRRATSWPTRRPSGRRPRAVPPGKTRARIRAPTRSTTTWTTRSTAATRSSPRDRRSGCVTPGSSTEPRSANLRDGAGLVPASSRISRRSFNFTPLGGCPRALWRRTLGFDRQGGAGATRG